MHSSADVTGLLKAWRGGTERSKVSSYISEHPQWISRTNSTLSGCDGYSTGPAQKGGAVETSRSSRQVDNRRSKDYFSKSRCAVSPSAYSYPPATARLNHSLAAGRSRSQPAPTKPARNLAAVAGPERSWSSDRGDRALCVRPYLPTASIARNARPIASIFSGCLRRPPHAKTITPVAGRRRP
jgi:hypothetical protein